MLERPRRLRKSQAVRNAVAEVELGVSNLMQPLFVMDGEGKREEIASMPGTHRFTLDLLLKEVGELVDLGITQFVVFPKVKDSLKDSTGSYGWSAENFYLHALTAIKHAYPEVVVMTDVALDPYSSDGHDGIVKDGVILNDETIEVLQKMAVAQAKAGADIIGPSDMMDGRVEAIRSALDEAGFSHVSIMSYSAKYASAYYGPFRDALDSAPKAGDKKTYQMDFRNGREALREAELDVSEGADYIMVKPAVNYMDVILRLRQNFDVPVAAYHVSGECSMLHAAAQNGWLDLEKAVTETLYCLRRAGAHIIITYFAKYYAELQKG